MNKKNLEKIATTYDTPLFMFDIDALHVRMKQVKTIVTDKIHLCYAMKANPFLVQAMDSCVEKFEVCSPGELSICENLDIAMNKIIFSGVQKTHEDFIQATKDNVALYTAESLLHVTLLNKIGIENKTQYPVILRLNGGSQFGMSKADLLYVIKNRDRYKGLSFIGLHYFVGTQRKKLDRQKNELTMLKDLLFELKTEYNFTVQKLEYGPGLPVPYFTTDSFEDTLAPLKKITPQLLELSTITEVTIEMGRFFTAECGYYITKVMDTKSNLDAKTGTATNYALVDGGINHFNYLGQNMGMKIPIMTHLKNIQTQNQDTTIDTTAVPNTKTFAADVLPCPQTWMLCGSLCTTADVLVRKIDITNLQQGDTLVFHNIGAYAITEGLNLFLSRKLPNVLFYQHKKCHFARKNVESYKINLIHNGETN